MKTESTKVDDWQQQVVLPSIFRNANLEAGHHLRVSAGGFPECSLVHIRFEGQALLQEVEDACLSLL